MNINKNLLLLAFGVALLAPLPASAQMRPDPLGYSGLFWPNYAIFGRTVHKKTKFGILVCKGAGVKGSTHRVCNWK